MKNTKDDEKDTSYYKDMKEIHRDLPNIIREICKEKGITPDQLGIDLSASGLGKTTYDISENPEKNFYKIRAIVTCATCKREVMGDLILDRKELKVVDTSGFMIFENPMCDECVAK